jgi:hypothetical protein
LPPHSLHEVLGVWHCNDREEDEYLQLSETVVTASVKQFTQKVIQYFGAQYLNRCPTAEEKKRAEFMMAQSGFPGHFGCWDCKHFMWLMCPLREAGQFQGKEKKKTIILENVADRDGYMWFTFFGEPGSLNDINILDKSSIVSGLVNGKFDMKVPEFQVGKVRRDFLSFLADGIYPSWSILTKTISSPLDQMESKYNKQHEFLRKDVERSFGKFVKIYQSCDRPFRFWFHEDIVNMLNCCIIFHNMTVEARRDGFKYNNVMLIPPEPADDVPEEEILRHSLTFLDGNVVDGNEGSPVFTSIAHKNAVVYDNMLNDGFHREFNEAMLNHIYNKFHI